MERYVIHVTKRCNCKCLYCYEDDKTSVYTWVQVKKVIDDILKYNNKFEVEFLGGEPLLAFDIIKKSVEYLNKRANVNGYYITTNGTIISDEIINFLENNNNIYIAISMDGTKFMNQLRLTKAGNNTHDKVMENFNKLKSNIDINRIMFHLVTHPYNIDYLSDGVEHLYSQGVRIIDIGIIEKYMTKTEEYLNSFIEQHKKISLKMKNGFYKELIVTTLQYKPSKNDSRNYIKDNTGKTVVESYGRTENDITGDLKYDIVKCSHSTGDINYRLKYAVYKNHQKIMKGVN